MNDDVQKKYLEFQIIQQQMQQMQQQQSLVNNQIAQLSSLRDALESLSTTPANREILVPLGAGVFVKGSLMDTKDVVMQVGAKASVMKSVPDARAVVEKQIEEMQSFLVELQKGMQQFSVRMAELQTEIQGAMQQEQQAEKSKK